MPALPPQTYTPARHSSTTSRSATPEWSGDSVEDGDQLSKKREVVSAGFVETQAAVQAIANSKGLFAYDRYTAADYNLTARTPDGTGSGWASRSFNELKKLDPRRWRPPRSRRRRSRRAPSRSSLASTRSSWSRPPSPTCSRS